MYIDNPAKLLLQILEDIQNILILTRMNFMQRLLDGKYIMN